MVLRTLEMLGPPHGYGLARRIEQTSGDRLQLNYGGTASTAFANKRQTSLAAFGPNDVFAGTHPSVARAARNESQPVKNYGHVIGRCSSFNPDVTRAGLYLDGRSAVVYFSDDMALVR
jgi:hypothetical protein